MASIAVVLPFYQRQSGLLRRALASVFAQEDVAHEVEVFLVDDGSPVPAEDELTDLDPAERRRVHLFRTTNAGPSAARNFALDQCEGTAGYLAFIDSDDQWYPHHLATALQALEASPEGAAAYFCNRWVAEQGCSGDVWRRDQFTPPMGPVPGAGSVGRLQRGFARFLMSSMLHTSGLVCRVAGRPAPRFDTTISRAEDYLYFVGLAVAGSGVLYDMRPGFIAGRGVSISRSTWGTPENLEASLQLGHALREMSRLLTGKRVPPSLEGEHAYIAACIRSHDRDMAAELLHHAARLRFGLCLRHLMRAPAVLPRLPLAAADAVLRRFGRGTAADRAGAGASQSGDGPRRA